MPTSLRERVASDQDFLKEPTEVLKNLSGLHADQLSALMVALQKGDRKAAAEALGLSVDSLDKWFREAKQRSVKIVDKYPDLI